MSDSALALAIDTSAEGLVAQAALEEGNAWRLIAERRLSPRNISSELIPAVDHVLAQGKASLQDLRALICVVGPGSFTGLRIGISAVKAFSEAAGVPIIAVSSLAVLSTAAGEDAVPAISAGRGQWYVSLTGPDERVVSEDDLRRIGGEHALVFAEEAPAACGGTRVERSSSHIFRAVLPRFLQRAFDDVTSLDANYVRRAYMEPAGAAFEK